MPSSRRMGSVAAAALAASLLVLLLHGCSQEPTVPSESATRLRYNLTIGPGSSSASGTVTSNLGGISCSIAGATGGADVSGTCSRSYEAGTVVSVTASAADGSVL